MILQSIAEKINQVRELRRLSIAQLANQLEISQSTYINMEMGKCNIPLERLFYLSHFLYTCPSYFLNNDTCSLSDYSSIELLLELGYRQEQRYCKDKIFAYPLLREIREKRDLSQVEIAKRLGCSRDLYVRIESGNTSPRLRTYFDLIAILNISPCFLLRNTLLSLSAYSNYELLNELIMRDQEALFY